MPNPFFKFKQFTVFHDKCSMKVGTDGVLLGAWADVEHSTSALDVGTGTGLIALMLAQRNPALQLTALDIDTAAVEQAIENVKCSAWGDRIVVKETDFSLYSATQERFDLIVSNPPYFRNSLKCPNDSRATARHTDSLSFADLIKNAAGLLSKEGRFCVVIPTDAMEEFLEHSAACGLSLSRRMLVCTKPDIAPKRVLLELKNNSSLEVKEELLVVELARHQYSEAYIALTRDFYLKM